MTQKETEPQRTSRIPKFKSRDEEAAWFDTHDLADYQDKFRTVRARFVRNLSEGLNIRQDPETRAELRARAHVNGIGPTTLARMWILEHLAEVKDEEKRHSQAL